jgi:hypothetical protein
MIVDKGLYIFEDFDLTVITLDNIFAKTVSVLDNKEYIIYNNTRLNIDEKKYILSFTFQYTCEQFINLSNLQNKVLLIQPSFADYDYELYEKINKQQIVKFVMTSFKKAGKHLPLPIFVQDHNIDLTNEHAGELIELLNMMSKKVDIHLLKTPNLSKIKQFSTNNGLKYLSDTYFPSQNLQRIYYQKT